MPVRSGRLSLSSSNQRPQAVCATLSQLTTPGTIGSPGKCPLKNHSSPEKWYYPIDCPVSNISSLWSRSIASRSGRYCLILFWLKICFMVHLYKNVFSASMIHSNLHRSQLDEARLISPLFDDLNLIFSVVWVLESLFAPHRPPGKDIRLQPQ